MNFEATYCALLVVIPGSQDDHVDRESLIEQAVDRFSDELIRLNVIDPIISGSISSGEIEVTVTVEAENHLEGVKQLDSAVRAAFHAAEVHTPDWQVIANSVTFRQLTATNDVGSENLIEA